MKACVNVSVNLLSVMGWRSSARCRRLGTDAAACLSTPHRSVLYGAFSCFSLHSFSCSPLCFLFLQFVPLSPFSVVGDRTDHKKQVRTFSAPRRFSLTTCENTPTWLCNDVFWLSPDQGRDLNSCVCSMQEESMEMSLRGSLQRLRYTHRLRSVSYVSLLFIFCGQTESLLQNLAQV